MDVISPKDEFAMMMKSVLTEHLDPVTKKLEDTITRFDDQAEQQEENQKKIEAEIDSLKKELTMMKKEFLNYNHELTVSSKITQFLIFMFYI